uniref:RIMS binding protein 2 n=1 Tax=Tetraodon nigroviridis TaxID=99883 RepID=H3CCW0_TETNG
MKLARRRAPDLATLARCASARPGTATTRTMVPTRTPKLSSPWWPGSTCTSTERWTTMASTKGSCWTASEDSSRPTLWSSSRTRRRPRSRLRRAERRAGLHEHAPPSLLTPARTASWAPPTPWSPAATGPLWTPRTWLKTLCLIPERSPSSSSWRGVESGPDQVLAGEAGPGRLRVPRVRAERERAAALSDQLRCSLLVGANVVVAPCGLRVDDIQRDTAELSWLPSNSNYAHTVFLDGVEYAVAKPGKSRLRFVNLKPLTVYKVTVVAQPHQVPWQLPLEQRERKEAGVEFCTQTAGPPLPPQDVHVLCLSNGVNVVGYALPPLLRPPQQPVPPRPACARDLDAKEPPAQHRGAAPPGQPAYSPICSAIQGRSLEPPPPTNLRSPSPQRILPQPRGTLISDTVAKAIAREAAQRVAAEHNGKAQLSPEQLQRYSCSQGSRIRDPAPSVDEFLRSSELGRPVRTPPSVEDYHSESSRGSDLSDIMEEDEEELYSEIQLDEGRRRNSHNMLKVHMKAPAGGRDRRAPGGGPQARRPLLLPSTDAHQDRLSPTYFDDSESEESFRIFVALFDYDPSSMSPNPDAADEELPFKEGQIIKVCVCVCVCWNPDKDTDGFYRGELRGRSGLIPCNMVSEIRAEDQETLQQLIRQGFLPLSTPVDRIEQKRRGGRRDQMSRRMVDVCVRQAELTFCAGDIIAVFGDIDEDGFYYGEMNGHRALVPSNFLEEVPDDVEVYLTDTPSHPPQEEPSDCSPAPAAATATAAAVSEGKRVHHHRRRCQR